MRIFYYILGITLFLLYTGCNSDDASSDAHQEGGISLKLIQQKNFGTKAVDDDNLASEQIVKNISIFFTEPSSNIITNKYINAGFTSETDHSMISLPLDPATLNTKDVYIIANYGDQAALNAASTVDDLKLLTTPAVDKTNNLAPEKGFCMYGSLSGFNFNDGTNSTAVVSIVRTCAKIRLTVTFPEDAGLSTNNSYLIQDAARYTYVVKGKSALPAGDYFTYANNIPLTDNGAGGYTATTYVYEATLAPTMYIYTHIDNSADQQEHSAKLPVPARNWLYDISVQIYQEGSPLKSADSSADTEGGYVYRTSVKVYDENGRLVTTG